MKTLTLQFSIKSLLNVQSLLDGIIGFKHSRAVAEMVLDRKTVRSHMLRHQDNRPYYHVDIERINEAKFAITVHGSAHIPTPLVENTYVDNGKMICVLP